MILPGILLMLAVVAFFTWSSRHARSQLLRRIRSGWARPVKRSRDMEGISDWFLSRDEGQSTLDDRTWNDLLMDDVFAHLDRTQSTVGQQILYSRLRSAPRFLAEFNALADRISSDAVGRESAQLALAGLNDPSGYYIHRLTRPHTLQRRSWHVLFPLWGATVLITLSLSAVWANLLFTALIVFVVNLIIRGITAGRIKTEITWFRQVGPLLSAARIVSAMDGAGTTAITESLKSDVAALAGLGRIASWVSRDPARTNDIVYSFMEYLNILLLLDANALYFAGRELELRAPQLKRVIETVGEIDAAIAIASFRAETQLWTRPQFVGPNGKVTLTHLSHPLVENPVPNSLALAPPHGLLVTGSNMSGKSTLLRTVGVNVVLAQTVYTALAESYSAPVYQVRSCIGRADDLIAGKSYYLVEVESVLALVRASDQTEPHLFIFDELFRGTNAVERIAAAEAVLRALIGRDKPHVTLAATHDGELVDLLSDSYEVCHFGDSVGPQGLIFDYQLTAGPATSRNAIALLKLNGAPESVVNAALARAAELDHLRL